MGMRLLLGAMAVGIALLLGSPLWAAEIECKPPVVMILQDKSGSMRQDGDSQTSGTQSKWDIAVAATKTMMQSTASDGRRFEEQIAFGLTLFPSNNSCAAPPYNNPVTAVPNDPTGNYVVPAFSPSTATTQQSTLIGTFLNNVCGGPSTSSCPDGSTPIIDSMVATKNYFKTNYQTYIDQRKFIILITDGAESGCYSGSETIPNAMRDIARLLSEGCFNPTTGVESTNATTCAQAGWVKFGVRTFVIGFGTGINQNQLNTLAYYGGTAAFVGVDPQQCVNGSNPPDCFVRANIPSELTAAMNKMAKEISDEICDGKDNNCDGKVDEGFGIYVDDDPNKGLVQCQGTNGVCAGFKGHKECKGDTTVVCSVDPGGSEYKGSPEICDGKDNDCNGIIDDGFTYKDPVTGKNVEVGKTCNGIGECGPGVVECACPPGNATCQEADKIGVCSSNPNGSNPQNKPEICDGKDNDCDGQIDEDFQDQNSTCGFGQCQHTVPACIDGKPASCDPFDGKEPEKCDNIDNDCDGMVDNFVTECTSKCGSGKKLCTKGQFGPCSAAEPKEEVCDGIDNDCNGKTDDGAKCPNPGEVCMCGKCQKPAVNGECLGVGDNVIVIGGYCVVPGCPSSLTCNTNTGACDGTPVVPEPGPDPVPEPWEPDPDTQVSLDTNGGNDGSNVGNDGDNPIGSDGSNTNDDGSNVGNDGDNPNLNDGNTNTGTDGTNTGGDSSAIGDGKGGTSSKSGCGCSSMQERESSTELIGAFALLLLGFLAYRRRRLLD